MDSLPRKARVYEARRAAKVALSAITCQACGKASFDVQFRTSGASVALCEAGASLCFDCVVGATEAQIVGYFLWVMAGEDGDL